MKYKKLGKSGIKVSEIGFGAWSIALDWWGKKIEEDEAKRMLKKAYDLGINHWDTADVYGDGRSESIIGKMWKEVSRNEIFLATKVGWDMGSYDHWYHPAKMIENMERSLSNLNTECVDLMYLHHCNFGKNEEFFDDALDVLTKFLESGKTKFIGLSDWSDKKIMQYIDRVSPDVVQPYRNVMDDSYEISGLKNYIDSNNVGVCFFSPIKHGLLTGKYKKPPKFKDGDYRKNVDAFNNQEIIDLLLMNKEKLSDRFSNHSQPVMHGLISPILEDAPTGCVLLGQRNEEQVVKASQLGSFISKEDAEWVKKLYKI